MNNLKFVAEVAVNAPIESALSYLIDSNTIQPGTSVEVPLGKRKVSGIILNTSKFQENDSPYKLKPINTVNEDRPLLNPTFIKWCKWLSSYYFYPLGMVLELAYPPLRKKNSSRKTKYKVIPDVEKNDAPNYTPDQKKAISNISNDKGFNVHLLHGVTGSGKTEVYLKLIEDCLKNNKTAIILVPEISLTPQLLHRFAARYPNEIAIIHSQLTAREKTNQWWSIYDKKKRILLGARSALFCPIEDIGLIIVDEEHEPSYKQDEKLKYNGRDSAIMLAKVHNCPIVLGSATPSLETYHNAISNKYTYHVMNNRVHQSSMPSMSIVNIKQERDEKKESNQDDLPFWLSKELYSAIQFSLTQKKQTALFLNRRGIAQVVVCPDCGFVYECPNCEISLTLHKKIDLICHYCDYSHRFAENCPSCSSIEIKPLGLGTEKVENDIISLFPEAKVERVDRDRIINRHQLEEVITKMEKQEIDILIGTQMIAKGLDFKNLQTVGLVLADIGFNLPNFRSSERSFQLVTQVSGRAGRNANDPGQVIIQAYNTEHPSLRYALTNNLEGFYSEELDIRERLNYPPYGKVAMIKFSSNHSQKLYESQNRLEKFNSMYKEKHADKLRILGPNQAPLYKLKNRYRHQMLILSQSHSAIQHYCKYLLSNKKNIFSTQVKVLVDIDPISMM